MLDRVVGSVVSPIVDSVDVDEVVDRIDVNHVVERLDVNELVGGVDLDAALDQVDVDGLLDRIDPDRLLDRVDPDRLLDRVDVDKLIQRVDVNAVIDRVDVDRVIDRVDVDKLIDRVDVDKLIDRVDVDKLIERVDVNAMIDRVDVNAMMDRVDVNALVERTEIGDIIARSTTGVFTQLLDVARTQIMRVDQIAQGIPAGLLRQAPREVPGIPGGKVEKMDTKSMTLAQRAVALQQHYSGSVSRFLAFLIDQFLIGILFALFSVLAVAALKVVTGTTVDVNDYRLIAAVSFFLWAFLYTAGSLAATGRTIGKALLGLRVVASDGTRLHGGYAALRTLFFPISFLIFGIGFLLGLIRRDRRELHDLIARTAVIYAWDASTAQLWSDDTDD